MRQMFRVRTSLVAAMLVPVGACGTDGTAPREDVEKWDDGLVVATDSATLGMPGDPTFVSQYGNDRGDGSVQRALVGWTLEVPARVGVWRGFPSGYHRELPGRLVRWSTTSGTVTPDTSRSDATGYARTLWTPAGTGVATVTARIPRDTGTYSVEIVPAALRADSLAMAPIAAHTCALTSEGAMYCWGPGLPGGRPVRMGGSARYVQITVGRVPARAIPCARTVEGALHCFADTLVVVPLEAPLVSIAGSATGVCGATAAGNVYCVDGTLRATPLALEVPITRLFATQARRPCGTTPQGEGWCGLGPPQPPGPVADTGGSWRVSSTLRFRQLVEAGAYYYGPFGCGVTTDGELHCWGSGTRTLVHVRQGESFRSVFAWPNGIGTGSACALTLAGRVDCLQPGGGPFRFGQWGTVQTGFGLSLTCGILLSGEVVCWGRDWPRGALGIGLDRESQGLPSPVLPP
jgi:hypothetical protein